MTSVLFFRRLMRLRSRRALLWAVLLVGAQSAMAAPNDVRWVTERDERVGLAFDVPLHVFGASGGDPTDALKALTEKRAGRTFFSSDKRAVLQFATVPNLDRLTVSRLRDRTLATSYRDAKVDYNRVAETWFVVSGTRDSKTFYERVHFSCGGQRLDIWSVIYPTAEAQMFDALVDELARRFRRRLAELKCS